MYIPTSTVIATLLFAFAAIFLGYDSEMERRENRHYVWEMFNRYDSLIKGIGYISIISSLLLAIYLGHWYSGAVVFVAGFFLGLLLLKILHWYVQPVSIIGVLVCYLFLVKILIEA